MIKRTMIIGSILTMLSAQAYDYGATIRRHEDIANYNKYYAEAELAMYKERVKKYKKLSRDLRQYGESHSRAMQSDAALVGYEAKMYSYGTRPSRSYASEWVAGETNINWRSK